jgi:hypothetical protein
LEVSAVTGHGILTDEIFIAAVDLPVPISVYDHNTRVDFKTAAHVPIMLKNSGLGVCIGLHMVDSCVQHIFGHVCVDVGNEQEIRACKKSPKISCPTNVPQKVTFNPRDCNGCIFTHA